MKRIFTPRVLAVLIAAVALAAILAVSSAVSSGTSFGERAVGTLLSPLKSGVAAITRQAERLYSYFYGYEALEAENRALREQIAGMEEENRAAAELQRENERLRELLNLAAEYEDYQLLPAYITGWDSTDYRSSFTIGRGSGSGLELGMCAVTEYGEVIGLVTDLGPNWARVTTVLDANLQISAQISGSSYTGVAQGTLQTGLTGDLRLDYLSADAVLKVDDLVVTAGSDRYPKGLTLGRVVSFGLSESGTDQYAALTAAVDFGSLEQVFLITEYTVH